MNKYIIALLIIFAIASLITVTAIRNITRNESNQIINSTINNLTTNSSNDVFNDLGIQYNDTNKIKIEKKVEQSTSKCRHTTGFQFWWMIVCIMTMLITIVYSYRKE